MKALGQDSKTCEKAAVVNTLRVCVRYCAKNYKAYPDCGGPSKFMSALSFFMSGIMSDKPSFMHIKGRY